MDLAPGNGLGGEGSRSNASSLQTFIEFPRRRSRKKSKLVFIKMDKKPSRSPRFIDVIAE